MTSFLPKLEDTLVDLLHYGDTGALDVSVDDRRWTFFVQGGVLIGIERKPALEGDLFEDPSGIAADVLTEAMAATNPLWDFREGVGPTDFGLFDVRQALTAALGRSRDASTLMEGLRPVLEGWPELKVDAYTLTGDEAVQAWLSTLDGLGPGAARLTEARADAGACLGALWVAWKLGDLDLHEQAIDDAGESLIPDDDAMVDDEDTQDTPSPASFSEPSTPDFSRPQHDDETAELDDETVTHLTEPPQRTLPEDPMAEEPSSAAVAVVASVRKDPFVKGVALARGGSVKEALPLLEAAFELDPERPGLEEWLGYSRFAACREIDEETARKGLNLLRDAMYRTGPTGETPILPWVLMARAQFERGDLVQSRSLLASVLQKESDDPEAMHLDTQLRKAEALARERRKKPEGVSLGRIVRMTSLVALLAVIVIAVQVVERYQPPRTDYAPEFADVMDLRELHRVPRGWVAVALDGWQGMGDPQAALSACQALAQATHMGGHETMTLISHRGVILAECGDRLQ